MTGWEYKTITLGIWKPDNRAALAEAGRAGWEAYGRVKNEVYMKRAMPSSDEGAST